MKVGDLVRSVSIENDLALVIGFKEIYKGCGNEYPIIMWLDNQEVDSCHLMSGGYDLLVVVKGSTLHQVASFVSERLATIGGVLSTATHFMLRSYKEQGYLLVDGDPEDVRPAVSP